VTCPPAINPPAAKPTGLAERRLVRQAAPARRHGRPRVRFASRWAWQLRTLALR
jgi:hypothetical protein